MTVNGDANVTGTWYANGTQILNSSKQLQNISYLDFSNSSLLCKTILRKSTISGSAGVEFYDTQFSTPTNQPLINFRADNNSAPIFLRMCGYLNNNSTMVAGGQPFDIKSTDGVGFTSGLNITCSNTTQASNSNYNVILSARNGTITHVVVNDSKNQLHFIQSTHQSLILNALRMYLLVNQLDS